MHHEIHNGISLLKVSKLSPEQSKNLREYLRLRRLNGNYGQHLANGDDQNLVGLFSPAGAQEVMDWLIQNGSKEKAKTDSNE